MEYTAVGLMSGSSLDGIDLVAVQFTFDDDSVSFRVLASDCYPLPNKQLLKEATSLGWQKIYLTDVELGREMGRAVAQFLRENKVKADVVAVHGHTLYHNPSKGVSIQLGHGAHIAAEVGLPVVCDLRSGDLSYGGQGAPMVPIAEAHLFSEHKVFINLGGIANISIHNERACTAYDVCPCNQVLNALANELGKPFDDGGKIAQAGTPNRSLAEELMRLPYFDQEPPKSLDNSFAALWIEILENHQLKLEDKMATVVFVIGKLIAKAMRHSSASLLLTGGGAYNKALVNSIAQQVAPSQVVLPSASLVDYKEAISTAYIGLLRFLEKPNFLSAASGSRRSSISGALYLPA